MGLVSRHLGGIESNRDKYLIAMGKPVWNYADIKDYFYIIIKLKNYDAPELSNCNGF